MKNPDIKWYAAISEAEQLPERCPFAASTRCPRFFDSVAAIGSAGTSSVNADQIKALVAHWTGEGLWPIAREERSSIKMAGAKAAAFLNFCPEVIFRRFDIFAVELSNYESLVDKELCMIDLKAEGAAPDDPRWQWKSVSPLHYSACTFYPRLKEHFDELSEEKEIMDAVIVEDLDKGILDGIKDALDDLFGKR